MKKKGISAIVATVLIILITVAGVTIIWAAIVPMIQNKIEIANLNGQVTVVGSDGYTFQDTGKNIVSVQLKRSADTEEMPYVNVVLSFGGNSVSTIVSAPDPNQGVVYQIDASGFDQELDTVSVSPIFIVGKKKYEGSVTSSMSVSGARSSGSLDVKEVLIPGTDYSKTDLLTGLVSWWRFEGDFTDSIGDNGGIEHGDNINTVGAVLNLDGTTDWLDIGEKDITYSKGTISLWFNPHRAFDGGGNVWYFLNDIDSDFYLEKNNVPSLRFLVSSNLANDDWKYNFFSPASGLNRDQWNYMAVSWDTSIENSATLYLNGDNLGTSTNPPFIPNSPNDLKIGRINYWFDGSMDNVMIFNEALMDEEITAIYENQMK